MSAAVALLPLLLLLLLPLEAVCSEAAAVPSVPAAAAPVAGGVAARMPATPCRSRTISQIRASASGVSANGFGKMRTTGAGALSSSVTNMLRHRCRTAKRLSGCTPLSARTAKPSRQR